ncbi:MAG: FKBP-type peptidyl-prolyl cis-trans isomerase [Bacteroidota bacterium]
MLKPSIQLVFLLFVFAFVSCEKKKPNVAITNSELNKPLQNANRALVKKGNAEIDAYVKRRNLQMTETGTGLRYMIYKNGVGVKAESGNYVNISFKVSLLDGTVCYSTDKKGPQEVLIGQDHVESGIHEGLQLMHVGDKAIFILPPNIAHGLIGDQDKIPPLSTIIYDVELISLR